MLLRRSPHGERGLKYKRNGTITFHARRSPHGERGLKYFPRLAFRLQPGSLPTRGAWIEIPSGEYIAGKPSSLPTRGAWIEIPLYVHLRVFTGRSLPTRGAWIEISTAPEEAKTLCVAPHTGSVD